MAKKSRIILVGPTCSGKNYLKTRFINKGYIGDVSYTTREPREGEVDGVDYHFITIRQFENMIKAGEFYEHIEYDNICYGTGLKEWEECDIFIMETDGVSKLTEEDRATSFIMFINPERMVREIRMRTERKWELKKVVARAKQDFKRFATFKNYDMLITNPKF